MERILPFRGLKYNKNIVGNLSSVLAPPYDVISEETQKTLLTGHPFNVIRLEYGQLIDTDTDIDNRYTRSKETLTEWIYSGVLLTDRQPSLYIYGQQFEDAGGNTHVNKGVICLVHLDEFETGKIIPHEQTLLKAKSDRLKLLEKCEVNFSPVYALYEDEEHDAQKIISGIMEYEPEISVKTPDGMLQTLWSISDNDRVSGIISLLKDKIFYIADGHQRYAAALEYRNMMRDGNPDHTGNEPYNYVMMYLSDINDPGTHILPIHRMVKNIVGFNESGVISMLENIFTVEKVMTENVPVSAAKKLETSKDIPAFAMYTGKDYFYFLKLKNNEFTKDVSGPDVTVLHKLVFGDVFDMSDADIKNQTYLSYTEDINEAVNGVREGNFQCSFMLNPVKMEEIKEISAMQEKMPQKSTYFYPKIKTGLVMNKLN